MSYADLVMSFLLAMIDITQWVDSCEGLIITTIMEFWCDPHKGQMSVRTVT